MVVTRSDRTNDDVAVGDYAHRHVRWVDHDKETDVRLRHDPARLDHRRRRRARHGRARRQLSQHDRSLLCRLLDPRADLATSRDQERFTRFNRLKCWRRKASNIAPSIKPIVTNAVARL
jgi:hypothetical protein